MRKIAVSFLFTVFLGMPAILPAQTNALSFDGVNDYINVTGSTGYNVGLSTHFTIEAWIKTGVGGDMAILSKTDPAQDHRGFEFIMSDGKLVLRWRENATQFHRYQTFDTFNDNVWHHVAVSVHPPSGKNVRFIVDGVEVQSSGLLNPMSNSSNGNTLIVGIRHGGSMPFNGLMDELRFWNLARSVEQVAAGRGCILPGNSPGLNLYYRFNQGTAGGSNAAVTSCTDAGVNNLTGTLFNFALTGATSNWVDGSANGVLKACNVPEIISFSPDEAVPGTSVTITGNQFNPTPANNIVHFGNVRATVTAASFTSLTVTVPQGSGYQPIQVTNTTSSFSGFSKKPFLPLYNPAKGGITSGDFSAARSYATGNTPGRIITGDLDGDGKTDVALVNRNDGSLSIFRNRGTGSNLSFANKIDLGLPSAGATPRSLAIGDLDRDGKPDIVSANYQDNTVSIWKNTGTAGNISFDTRLDFAYGNTPSGVVITDLNADGLPDVAFTSQTGNQLVVMRNTGAPGTLAFAPPQTYACGTAPRDILSGDFDGDGAIDLATLNGGNFSITVFRNTTPVAGTIQLARTDFSVVGTIPLQFVTGDFDQNGKMDFAVSQFANNLLSVFANNSTPGNMSFAGKVDFSLGSTPGDIAAGDINGDGKPDVMMASPGANSLGLFINNGNNSISFSSPVFINTASSPYGATLCDVNQDNRTDLLTTSASTHQFQVFENILPAPSITGVSPLIGTPGSNIIIQGSGFTANNPGAHTVFVGGTKTNATLSLGGSLLFVPAPANANYKSISVGINGKSAIFHKPYANIIPGALPFSSSSFRLFSEYDAGSSPSDAVIADFDGDGKNDMVVPNTMGGSFTIFRNITSGSIPVFFTSTGTSSGTIMFSDAFDMDADGKTDLVNTYISGVGVMKNNSSPGNISFGTDQFFSAGNYNNVTKAAIADFDADGLPDMVISSLTSPVVVVMRNVSIGGNFQFTPVLTMSLPGNGGGVAVGDFNSDGKPDIAATSQETGTISVITNTSAGRIMSFGERIDIGALTNSRAIVAADFDNDQRTDLAVAHFNGSRISIWSNQTAVNGPISFAFDMNLMEHQSGSLALEVADLNGDARPDLLVNGSNSVYTLHAYFNNSTVGNLQFDGSVKTILNTRRLRAIEAGDLDGDNLPDIVTLANDELSTNKVQLYLNHINEPFITGLSIRKLIAGREVIIQGSGFTGATGVSFGNWPAHSFTVNSNNQITAIVGGGGNGFVTISNANSSYTAFSDDLRVDFDPHIIHGLDKNHAPAGAEVRIFGQNFLPGNTTDNIVYFGNVRAKVVSATNNEIRVLVPTGTTSDHPVSVAIYNRIVQSRIRFYLSFSPIAALNPALFSNRTELSTEGPGTSLLVADLDNDNKPDIATANIGQNLIRIQLNSSTLNAFSLTTGITLPTQGGPGQIVAHDMNGDGRLDLAIVNTFGNTISVYRNNSTPGNPQFVLVDHFAANTSPRSVYFADINKDGRPEMLAVSDAPNVFSMWRNTGIGNNIVFTNKTDFPTGSVPFGITATELGGLQGFDVITANRGDGAGSSISVFRNMSTLFNFNFEARQDIAISSTNGIMVPVGIDMDNSNATFDDILVPEALSGYVSLLENTSGNSSLSFKPRVDYPTGNTPTWLSQGNLNGDDKIDIATGSFINAVVSLLPNTSANGNKTFGAPIQMAAVGTGFGLAIADMNGDGRPDIITANGNAGNVSIFRNTAPGLVSFSPSSAAAGRIVTIYGNNLSNVTAVSFGGVPALSFSLISPTEIRAVVGSGNSGNIAVTTQNGTYTISGFTYIASGNKLYVSAASITLGEGQGWSSPLSTLSDAIARANILPEIDSILVASGTYYPTGLQSLTNRDSSLVLNRGNLKIIGGYNPATGNRDPGIFETVISGNIGGINNTTDNSHHLFVVTAPGNGPITLDGLTLRDALANGVGNMNYNSRFVPRNRGSGLHNDVNGQLQLINCRITKNTSTAGGAIFTMAGKLRIQYSLLDSNLSGFGGAVRAENSSELFIEGNTFFANASQTGGGGAMNNNKLLTAKDTIVNNLFIRNRDANTSNLVAGGIALVNGDHYVVNNTFYADSAVNNGGAVYISGPGKYELFNNIFYKNHANNGPDVFTTGANVNYIQANNSFGNSDPLLINEADPDGPDNVWGTLDDGLRIDVGSPAFNAGDLLKKPDGIISDMSRNPRVMFNGLDIGAYEGLQTAVRCEGTPFVFNTGLAGSTYSWERNSGNGFQPLADGSGFAGTQTGTLQILSQATQIAGHQFRCKVTTLQGIIYSPIRTVTYGMVWKGTQSIEWTTASNWTCGQPGTAYTVIIPPGTQFAPSVNANSTVAGLLLMAGANLDIPEGVQLMIKK